MLVDLHGQHEHQVLLDPATHLDLLDEFAGLDAERVAVAGAFAAWQHARAERDRLLAGARENASRAEFLAFQLAEIDGSRRRPARTTSWRRIAPGARATPTSCSGSAPRRTTRCTRASTPRCRRSAIVWRSVWRARRARRAVRAAPRRPRRRSSRSSRTWRSSCVRTPPAIDASPARLQEVEDRLAALERLKRKHGPALADVIAKRRDAAPGARTTSRTATERAAELDGELAAARAAYRACRRTRCRERGAGGGRRSRERSRSRCRPGDGAARAARSASPTRDAESGWSDAGHRDRRSSTSRRTPARTSGRWRASPRAESCRGSCWR